MAEINDSTKKTTKGIMGGLMSLLRGSNRDSETLGKNSSDSEILGGIYKLMVQKEAFNKLEYERRKNYLDEEEIEKNKRHNEIIKALSIRRKPAPKKIKAKKRVSVPQMPGIPGKGPKPSRAPAPARPSAPAPAPARPSAPAPAPARPSAPAPAPARPSAPAPAPAPAPARPSAPAPSQTPPKPDAGEIARQQAAERARQAALEKTRKDAEDKARKEAQERAAREAQERTAREAADAAKIERQRRAAREAQERAAREAARRRDTRTVDEEKAVGEAGKAAQREAARRQAEEARRQAEATRRQAEEARRRESATPPAAPPSATPAGRPDGRAGRGTGRVETPPAAPPTATPAPRPPATATPAPAPAPSAARVPIVTSAIIISGAALASMKGEQGVSSAAEALAPVTNERTAKKIGLPIGVSRVGAATPDLQNSTSYGLFGINNIRAIDQKTKTAISNTSTLDSFVQMFPNFGLPDPGSHVEPDKTKKFNEAWWNLARTRPEELLKAQLQWFDKKFEQPTKNKLLENFAPNIANNPGVIVFMTDRKIQYGPGIAFRGAALEEGKKAKTPEEFIKIISDYDRKNLRGYFRRTPDEQYKELERGLLNRIELRIQKGMQYINSSSATPTQNLTTVPSTVGSSVNDASVTNTNARRQMSSRQNTTPLQQITNNVNMAQQAATELDDTPVDDSSPYSRKNLKNKKVK